MQYDIMSITSKSVIVCVSVLAMMANVAQGFIQPAALATITGSAATKSTLNTLLLAPSQIQINIDLNRVHNHFLSLHSFSLADDLGVDPSVGASVLWGISSVATFVGGLFLFFVVLSVIVMTFIIPAAAKELEENVKTKYPDLWREYSAKLEAGEDFSRRPDLMQELGTKVQKLQLEEFERAQAAATSAASKNEASQSSTTTNESSSPSSSSSSSSSSPGSSAGSGGTSSNVIDVEFDKD